MILGRINCSCGASFMGHSLKETKAGLACPNCGVLVFKSKHKSGGRHDRTSGK